MKTKKRVDQILGRSSADEVFDLVNLLLTMKGGRSETMVQESKRKALEEGQVIDLPELVRLLVRHAVEFVIIGGYAVAFHGHIRFTKDLDILYHATPENVTKILAALRAHGVTVKVSPADLLGKRTNYKVGHPPDQLDMSADEAIDGLNWIDASRKAVDGELAGVKVKFIDFDSLIAAKKFAGRARDLDDIERLMKHLGEW